MVNPGPVQPPAPHQVHFKTQPHKAIDRALGAPGESGLTAPREESALLHGRPGGQIVLPFGLKPKKNQNPDNHRAHFMPSGHWAEIQGKARPTFPGGRPKVHKGQTALTSSLASLGWVPPKQRGKLSHVAAS